MSYNDFSVSFEDNLSHNIEDGRHLKYCQECRYKLAKIAMKYAKKEISDIYGDWL